MKQSFDVMMDPVSRYGQADRNDLLLYFTIIMIMSGHPGKPDLSTAMELFLH